MSTTSTTTRLGQLIAMLAAPTVAVPALIGEWVGAGFDADAACTILAPLFDDGQPVAQNLDHGELSPYGPNLRKVAIGALLERGLAAALRGALSAPADVRADALDDVWELWSDRSDGAEGGDRIIAGINAKNAHGYRLFPDGAGDAAAMLLAAADTTPDPDATLARLGKQGPTPGWATAVEDGWHRWRDAGFDGGASDYEVWCDWLLLAQAGLYEPNPIRVSADDYRACLTPAHAHAHAGPDADRWTVGGDVVCGIARRLHAAMRSLRNRACVSVELTKIGYRGSGYGDRDYDYTLNVWSEGAYLGSSRSIAVSGTYTIHTTAGGAVEFGAAIDSMDSPSGLVVRTTGGNGLGMTEFDVGQVILDGLGLDRIVRDALVRDRIAADYRPAQRKAGEVMSLTAAAWGDELASAMDGNDDLVADVMFVSEDDGTFLLEAGTRLGGLAEVQGPDFVALPSAEFAAYLGDKSLASFGTLTAEIAELPWASITAVFRALEP